CDHAGLAPPTNHPQKSLQGRQRRTATRKTGCQFSITAREGIDTQWELRHRPGIEYSIHNHPPSQSISSHPAHRKLAQAEINQARSLHSAGVKPGQTITYLRQITTNPIQPYDIYNSNASCKNVILVDNTYKTNKFDMPLLHIIGITSSGMTFSIGFCFLPGETKEDFIWAFKCFQGLGINPDIIFIDGDQAQKNASE
ncbi:hypothetical protein GcM3_208043, partial [Golovinomyces cichoracearum]